MGLNLVNEFFRRVEVFYNDAKKALEHNKASQEKIKEYEKNHLVHNLIFISQGCSKGSTDIYDGFPLIPVIFNIIHRSYEIINLSKRSKQNK